MTFGAGKYDAILTEARKAAEADGAILIVLNGKHGFGFSCQADPVATARLPEFLEDIARQIRADLQSL
jgi:hypothetical protein